MKLSRERKVYVALLGLGALALGVDRLLPAPAAAETAPLTTTQAVPSPSPAAAPSVEPAPAQTRNPSFSVRVRRVTDGVDPLARDPFEAGKSWPRPKIKEEGTPEAVQSFEEFFASHKLTALSGPRTCPNRALISVGKSARMKICMVGDEIDGYLVVAMDKDGVELRSRSGERRRMDLAKATARDDSNTVGVRTEPGSDR